MNNKLILIIVLVSLLTLGVILFFRKRIVDYVLAGQNEEYLKELHIEARPIFEKFIKAVLEETGFGLIITSGDRSFAKQASLDASESIAAPAGLSYHNYGMAIDANAIKGTTWLKKSSSKQAWVNSGIPAIAKRFGIVWLGENTTDRVHFHYAVKGLTTQQLLAKAKQQFGSIENIKGNEVIV